MSEFDELRRLAEAATPGPWHQYAVTGEYVKAGNATIADLRYKNGKADAAYIAAANPATILRLLDLLQENSDDR